MRIDRLAIDLQEIIILQQTAAKLLRCLISVGLRGIWRMNREHPKYRVLLFY
jgi:hypothetical protein